MFYKIKLLAKTYISRTLQAFFLKRAQDITPTPPKGPILIIAPHPDDETLGCGGVAALYRAAGEQVRIIIVTDGGLTPQEEDQSREALISRRRKEAILAAHELGIPHEDVVFLSYPDGSAQASISCIAEDLASQLWLNPPVMVFSPYCLDEHTDHQAIASAVNKLQQEGKILCPVYEYPIWFWPRGALEHLRRPQLRKTHRKINVSSVLDKKRKAVLAHRFLQKQACLPLLEAYGIAANFPPFELFFERLPNDIK